MTARERAAQMKAYDAAADIASDYERFCEGWAAGKAYSQAENERLRKILEDYGQHTKSCESRRWVKSLVSGLEKPGKCNCGFEAALRPEQRKDGENGDAR